MNRWLALLVSIIAGGALAYVGSKGVLALFALIIWIFVTQDAPQPAWIDAAGGVMDWGVPLLCWVALSLGLFRLIRPDGWTHQAKD